MKGPRSMMWNCKTRVAEILAERGFETEKTVEETALAHWRAWDERRRAAEQRAAELEEAGTDRVRYGTYGVSDLRAGLDESYLFESYEIVTKAEEGAAALYQAALKVRDDIKAEEGGVLAECARIRERIPEVEVRGKIVSVRVHTPGARKGWNMEMLRFERAGAVTYLPVKYPSSISAEEFDRAVDQLLGKIPSHPACSCGCGWLAPFGESMPASTPAPATPPFNPLISAELFEKFKKQA